MNLMNGSAQKAGALLVVASVTITAPLLAGVTYSTISVGPDTPGWYN